MAYKEEETGPPLEHRLKSDDVVAMAKGAGLKAITIIPLKDLLLYKFLV